MNTRNSVSLLRHSLGITQAQFGRLFHAHWVAVSRWECGYGRPDSWQSDAMTIAVRNLGLKPARFDKARELIAKGRHHEALGVILAPVKNGKKGKAT